MNQWIKSSDGDEMNAIQEHVLKLLDASNLANKGEEDYEKNGLIYCGKCNSARQEYKELYGIRRPVPVRCKCEMDREAQYERQLEKEQRERNKNVLRQNSLLEGRYAKCRFDETELKGANLQQLMACKRYADKLPEMIEKNQGLLLCGGVGTGKTHLAACIANQAIEMEISVLMVSMAQLLNLFQAEYGAEAELMEKIARVKLFILDDLGAERHTEYGMEKLFNVVDTRYRSRMPMIVTSNLATEELKNTSNIGLQRIYDRIMEICCPIRFAGESRRRQMSIVLDLEK